MRRFARIFLLCAVFASAIGVAAPTASPPARHIAARVTVAGVPLGGLGSEPARDRVRAIALRPLRFRLDGRGWQLGTGRFGTVAAVDQAVADALAAPVGADLELPVRVDRRAIERYVARLAKKHDRAATDARLVGVSGLAPVFAAEEPGRVIRRQLLARWIERELVTNVRGEITVPTRPVAPHVTRAGFGPVIVISRAANALRLFSGPSLTRSFRVATGRAEYPTPAGTWTVVDMQRDPWWRPPDSEWAKDAKPIPPGPGNPLGTRWMGLSAAAVGIHGTPDAASIGYSASHGCIRMQVPEAEWLFDRVRLGTPVVIV